MSCSPFSTQHYVDSRIETASSKGNLHLANGTTIIDPLAPLVAYDIKVRWL